MVEGFGEDADSREPVQFYARLRSTSSPPTGAVAAVCRAIDVDAIDDTPDTSCLVDREGTYMKNRVGCVHVHGKFGGGLIF